MADQDLNRLKRERAQLRRKFTEISNVIEPLFEEEQKDTRRINDLFVKATDKAERLFRIDQSVSDLLFSLIEDEEELAREYDTTESYRERWLHICHQRDELFAQKDVDAQPVDRSVVSRSSSSDSNKRIYRLPKLEIEKFDGNIKNWIKFWAQFRKIHTDESLDEEDKFQYLLQSTLKGSSARELLESFPPSSSNYSKAIDQLKVRFGRDELLIELYVRELLNLVLAQANKKSVIPLSRLYDSLETQLRSLESLGVTSDKYACMLFPLVESALPESVLKEWERFRARLSDKIVENNPTLDNTTQLDSLLNFLGKEVECEERLALARYSFNNVKVKEAEVPRTPLPRIKFKTDSLQQEHIATAADLVNIKQQLGCTFCVGQHSSEMCHKAHNMTAEELKKILQDKGCCYRCLKKGHVSTKCKVNIRCILCSRRHSTLLCPDRRSKTSDEQKGEAVDQSLSNTTSNQVLLQTLRVKVNGEGKHEKVRMLIDTGSQRSYITKRLASSMQYKPSQKIKLSHALFGGAQTETKTHLCYKVRVESIVNNYACNFEVLDSDIICQKVPVVGNGVWVSELKKLGVPLSDVEQGPIDILVGADVAGKLLTGKREVLSSGLIAIETLLGWVVMGRVRDSESYMANINMLCTDPSVADLWKLDVLGIKDPVQEKSQQEKVLHAEQHFLDNVKTLEDGRYEVKLPWLEDHPPLSFNFELAKRRLDKTVSKLESAKLLDDYEAVFNDWLNEDIIEEVSTERWDVGHYLPHRPVIKEGSTTRIRPVFDASAHGKGKVSLNQ